MARKLSVLLVEDELLVRQTLQMVLKPYSDEITVAGEACNGLEAVKMIGLYHPDVIICDIVMPQMNGLELLAYVRGNHPDIHTVILSGYSDFPYVKSAFQQGIADYILKPELTPESLIACLRKIRDSLDKEDAEQEEPLGRRLLDYIEEHYREPITLQKAALDLHMSYSVISGKFSLATGKSFREALNDVRTDKAKQLLTDTDRSIMEIAGDVGYTDQSYFCRVFKSYTGESPLNYRNNRRRTKKIHEKLVVK